VIQRSYLVPDFMSDEQNKPIYSINLI